MAVYTSYISVAVGVFYNTDVGATKATIGTTIYQGAGDGALFVFTNMIGCGDGIHPVVGVSFVDKALFSRPLILRQHL